MVRNRAVPRFHGGEEGRAERWRWDVLNVITPLEQLINRRSRLFGISEEGVNGSDIRDHNEEAAREYEDEGNNANDANGVEAEK